MATKRNHSPAMPYSRYGYETDQPASWFEKALKWVRKPGHRQAQYPFKRAHLLDLSRYPGAVLRAIRAENGVGRPPAIAKAKRIAAWERGA